MSVNHQRRCAHDSVSHYFRYLFNLDDFGILAAHFDSFLCIFVESFTFGTAGAPGSRQSPFQLPAIPDEIKITGFFIFMHVKSTHAILFWISNDIPFCYI